MEEKNIIITTGDLKEDYEIIKPLYVAERVGLTYPKEEHLNEILTILNDRLKKQCKEIGGDAVVCCHIVYVPNSGSKLFSINGTAVKIKSKN